MNESNVGFSNRKKAKMDELIIISTQLNERIGLESNDVVEATLCRANFDGLELETRTGSKRQKPRQKERRDRQK